MTLIKAHFQSSQTGGQRYMDLFPVHRDSQSSLSYPSHKTVLLMRHSGRSGERKKHQSQCSIGLQNALTYKLNDTIQFVRCTILFNSYRISKPRSPVNLCKKYTSQFSFVEHFGIQCNGVYLPKLITRTTTIELGFEPTAIKSRVDHSGHCALEALKGLC